MATHVGFKVAPLRRIAIREIAMNWRRQLFGSEVDDVNLKRLIEMVLPLRLVDGFELEIGSEAEMGSIEGLTTPDYNHMKIREDVWRGGHAGRDKFTLGHEIGHLALHRGQTSGFARRQEEKGLPAYADSEWQANTFSAEFVMPFGAVSVMSCDEIMKTYKVTWSAANTRAASIRKELEGGHHRHPTN